MTNSLLQELKEVAKEAAKPVAAICCLAFAGCHLANFISKQIVYDKIPAYVQSILPEIMQEQERKIGIKHFGIPNIRYDIPSSYNPKIFNDAKGSMKADGHYNPLKNYISIDRNAMNIDPLRWKSRVKQIVSHELGHSYADKLNENICAKYNKKYNEKAIRDDLVWPNDYSIETQLVSEGIAKYFEHAITGEKDRFKDSDWPSEEKNYHNFKAIYDGGYHLVKPVIKRHGKKGINFLMKQNPCNDLGNLKEYQKRTLRHLSNPDVARYF